VLVSKEAGMSAQMQKILQVINKETPPLKKNMEINGTHQLILNLLAIFKKDPKCDYLSKAVEQLFFSVQLQDGFVFDPHKMITGIQSLLNDATSWYIKEHEITSE